MCEFVQRPAKSINTKLLCESQINLRFNFERLYIPILEQHKGTVLCSTALGATFGSGTDDHIISDIELKLQYVEKIDKNYIV